MKRDNLIYLKYIHKSNSLRGIYSTGIKLICNLANKKDISNY